MRISSQPDPYTGNASRGAPRDPLIIGDPGATTDASGASSAGATAAVDPTAPTVPDCLSLSPDALMAYCQSRLNSLDSQMTTIFDSQQENAKLTQDLNAVAGAFNRLPGPNNDSPPTVSIAPSNLADLKAAYENAITDAGASSALGTSLTADLAALPAADPGGGSVSMAADQVSTLTQSLKNDTGTLNSDSEMTMINLQSLMSQRQTAVQLTTNLVQALGQQASSITKNIGG